MPNLSIRHYFPFCRVKIQGQLFEKKLVRIIMDPDKRFHPICHVCGSISSSIHSYRRRPIRDLNLADTHVFIHYLIRKVRCPHCKNVAVEKVDFLTPCARVTNRLARYIHDLCKSLTVAEVARHLGLDWKTVKEIDKAFLEKQYGQTNYGGLQILAVDEIAVKKGHHYMTVVLDYETGRVVWMGKDRKAETLAGFFQGMNTVQRESIRAIAMDMWDPFIKASREYLPNAKIVFDLFHVVSGFNKVIDKVRNNEYRKARKEDRHVYHGSKYLLLRNHLKGDEKKRLKDLLDLNQTLVQTMILRDKLKELWRYKSRGWAQKGLEEWCRLARSLKEPALTKFSNMLEQFQYGILNHCDYPMNTSRLEGVNNKIKVIKRKAFGYHDERYFSLKVIQAFDPKS